MCETKTSETLSTTLTRGQATQRLAHAVGAGTSTPEPGGSLNYSRRKPEHELIQKFKEKFATCFERIEEEVYDTTRKNRIDMIVYPDMNTPMGIEFKRFDKRKHGKDLGMWLNQARRYSTALFPNHYTAQYQRIPIFVIPSVTHTHLIFNPDVHLRPEMLAIDKVECGVRFSTDESFRPHCEHNNVNSFIFSAFGVGEVRKLSNHNIIFSSNCLTVAEMRIYCGRWRCFVKDNKYNMLIGQINKL